MLELLYSMLLVMSFVIMNPQKGTKRFVSSQRINLRIEASKKRHGHGTYMTRWVCAL